MRSNIQSGEGRFALLVTGDGLPMDTVSELLALTPTRTVRKGDLLNRLPEIRAERDEWILRMPLTTPLATDSALNNLLSHLNRRQAQLTQVTGLGEVTLRLSVQSDTAQMTYRLMPQTLTGLAELGLPLEVSSVSWGEVGI